MPAMPAPRERRLDPGPRASEPPPSAAIAALGDAAWTVTSLMSPRSAKALELVSPTVHALLLPACQRVACAAELARQLRALPCSFGFPLRHLGPEVLREALAALRPLRPLRRRELVGHDAGWAPTEQEPWHFRSPAELQAFAACARAAAAGARRGQEPVLLLGAVLRRGAAAAEAEEGLERLAVLPQGLEWAEGPGADPLQLGLRLSLGPGDHAEVDLELGSGGWSPWAETWSLRDGTLGARICVAAELPGGGRAVIRRAGGSLGAPDACCFDEGVAALQDALRWVDGIRAAVCVSSLAWGKDAPPWCPPAVLRVTAAAESAAAAR
ncbi:unnamed protein product [Prorocentrum cordatum]|uniref:Uncharacterized protein n=1 Tax=Prorocentrum cordatum TaxID=2364126 RepID=A0ABN9R498_9DINO|nr:unnamed protein product [Polarella glacialis]